MSWVSLQIAKVFPSHHHEEHAICPSRNNLKSRYNDTLACNSCPLSVICLLHLKEKLCLSFHGSGSASTRSFLIKCLPLPSFLHFMPILHRSLCTLTAASLQTSLFLFALLSHFSRHVMPCFTTGSTIPSSITYLKLLLQEA